ncbi:MAG: hypothetical protein R6U13_05060 [Desulfatiglandaceae bacterium]
MFTDYGFEPKSVTDYRKWLWAESGKGGVVYLLCATTLLTMFFVFCQMNSLSHGRAWSVQRWG